MCSPPVLTFGTLSGIFPTPGSMCGEHSSLHRSTTINNCPIPRLWAQGEVRTVNNAQERTARTVHILQRSDGRKVGTSMRRGASPMGFYRRLPDVYPIFHPFFPRRAEGLCATSPLFSHIFGSRRALCASSLLIISEVEPRASSLRSATPSPLLPVLHHVQ